MSIVLNVSGPGLDCMAVALAMQRLGLYAHVSANMSVRGLSAIESGCSIVLNDKGDTKLLVRSAWDAIRALDNDIECAFVSSTRFKGCVLDYLSDSNCGGVV